MSINPSPPKSPQSTVSTSDEPRLGLLTPLASDDGRRSRIGPATPSFHARKNTVLKSHGRPPWYGEDGRPIYDAFVIGVAGGSASGKTHVARQIVRSLGSIPTVIILSQDSFYKRHTPEEIELAFASRFDFDHPDAIDMPMFAACLADLKSCRQTNIPIYSFAEHRRLDETKYLYGAAIIIAEGIMALHDPKLRAHYDLKLFVQCDSDLMLARRIKRDIEQRGRTVEGILEQYLRYVKPAYDNFVGPTARYADIIVPGNDNSVAIELISTHVRRQLKERSNRFRQRLAVPPICDRLSNPKGGFGSLRLTVLPQTPQLKGIYTILRDRSTSRQDFIFFVNRLSTFLVEKAMEHLPYRSTTITTPTGVETTGKVLDAKHICGVSILRSGGPLERGLARTIPDVLMGSLLVQSDDKTSEPLLLHAMLPVCIRDREKAQQTWVFLLDAQIGTAASAFMAIRILLDHGIRQDRIVFVTFLLAQGGGIALLHRAFPDVKIVTGAVDGDMKEVWADVLEGDDYFSGAKKKYWVMEPGMGQIGNRYYL